MSTSFLRKLIRESVAEVMKEEMGMEDEPKGQYVPLDQLPEQFKPALAKLMEFIEENAADYAANDAEEDEEIYKDLPADEEGAWVTSDGRVFCYQHDPRSPFNPSGEWCELLPDGSIGVLAGPEDLDDLPHG